MRGAPDNDFHMAKAVGIIPAYAGSTGTVTKIVVTD
mgnify:CR=1 FL=1